MPQKDNAFNAERSYKCLCEIGICRHIPNIVRLRSFTEARKIKGNNSVFLRQQIGNRGIHFKACAPALQNKHIIAAALYIVINGNSVYFFIQNTTSKKR